MKPWITIGVALALLLPLAEGPARAGTNAVSLGEAGVVELDLPEGWTADVQGRNAQGGPRIAVLPPDRESLLLFLSPGSVPGGPEGLADAIQKAVAESRRSLGRSAVEPEITARELKGPDCVGWCVSATDRTVEVPRPGHFRYADQGALAVGRLMVVFTLLSNDRESPLHAGAMDVVRSLRYRPPSIAEGTRRLRFPGKPWSLVLELPGYRMEPLQVHPDGKGISIAGENRQTGMIVSVFLEESESGWTARKHREELWRNLQKDRRTRREKVERYVSGEMAILSYRVPELMGQIVNQRSLNAILVHDGVWADIHLSKVEYEPEDRRLFNQVLASIRIEE